ncbi:hypothetical protein P170DRAFT_474669 [Aspergillus steynii IBT 23096]|uniref:Altered inheritance of mitochondria protein 6 n=1 Tax=Aspergillus steynii IBT 23096 TaxID=1392250 RepID=A0A2I2GE29_9EURO|nr:uncharacterized protein P170DRAFT_474669 [Aspergillus steynii IBT 23096]PLB51123.1 hypothetical protein P170DRAFT_474669 [Aspergillus steynii IBT 23096]
MPSRSPHFSNSAAASSERIGAGFALDKQDFCIDVNDAAPIQQRRKTPLWRRGLAALSPFSSPSPSASATKDIDDDRPLLSGASSNPYPSRKLSKRSKINRCFLFPLLGFFIMLGVVQFISIACGIVVTFFSDDFDRAIDRWRFREKDVGPEISHWPTDISRDIVPARCHSHNDYWRPIPLYSALQAGCVGVEADVWLFDNELYVGHTTSSLAPKRTLRNMYINPLLEILERQNPRTPFHPANDQPLQGVFDTDPSQTLVLLIDFKTDGEATWKSVAAQLSPLRERGYLSYFNGTDVVEGPITVVGTGNTPFNLVMDNTAHRDIFFDAPLEKLAENDDIDDHALLDPDQHVAHEQAVQAESSTENVGQGLSGIPAANIRPNTFNSTNSYYASVSFKNSIGFPWSFHLSEAQMSRIRAQIEAAHRRGLKVRYWGLPSWPRSLRNHIWSVLVREGVDILNVDDLQSATKKDWRPRISDWWS